jgi:hypothetical protein
MQSHIKGILNDTDATIPVDKEGANMLYVALAGTHTILPAAIIFNKAKKNWTLSMFEASNYGYFLRKWSESKSSGSENCG